MLMTVIHIAFDYYTSQPRIIQVKEIESFVIVYKYKDRFTSPFARTLRVITKMFGECVLHNFTLGDVN